MDRLDRKLQRQRQANARFADPLVADNMDVRKELLKRIKRGEVTLAEAQADLRKIQRDAKRNGVSTVYG